MKLNNKGWGFKEMIYMMTALFVFLIIATYFVFVLYGNLNLKESSIYIDLENQLAYAARDYISDGYLKKDVITLDELKNKNYITSFTDMKDEPCDGYVIYENNEYTPYITCQYFTSSGYNKNLS